jgi:iron uptake system component EfeO
MRSGHPLPFVSVGLLALALAGGAVGCSSDSSGAAPDGGGPGTGTTQTDEQYKDEVTAGMHALIAGQLEALVAAVNDIQSAAPTPSGRGWDDAQDAAALEAMKAAWRRARIVYEHIEGAVAPIFPDIDAAIDARYDDFMAELASVAGDDYAFDDKGVTGMHAVERILYSKTTPPKVVEFEKVLPGYRPAAYPATEKEAADFKNLLCGRLVKDVETIIEQWAPAKIDIATAYAGLVSLMTEQREKVNKASTGEEESRYAQLTLADIRANLEGTTTAYEIFRPWITSKKGADPASDGASHDQKIEAGFAALKTAYDALPGDAIPEPPPTWSSQNPTPADLDTPFGKLYGVVRGEADANREGSIVYEMNLAADELGFTRFKGVP